MNTSARDCSRRLGLVLLGSSEATNCGAVDGLLIRGAGQSGIRIAPPLIITQEQMETGLSILEESIKEAQRKL